MVTTATPVRVDMVIAGAAVHDAPMDQPPIADRSSLIVPARVMRHDVTPAEPLRGRDPETQPIATCDTPSAGAAAGQYPITLATNLSHITQSSSSNNNSNTAPSLSTKISTHTDRTQTSTHSSTPHACTPVADCPPPRGRPRVARSTARSEKRSESARPYKRSLSTSKRTPKTLPDTDSVNKQLTLISVSQDSINSQPSPAITGNQPVQPPTHENPDVTSDLPELKHVFQTNDIVLLTETWSSVYHDLHVDGFECFILHRDENVNVRQVV